MNRIEELVMLCAENSMQKSAGVMQDWLGMSAKKDLIPKIIANRVTSDRRVAKGLIGGGGFYGGLLGGAFTGNPLGVAVGAGIGALPGIGNLRAARRHAAAINSMADKVIQTEKQRNKAVHAAGAAGLAAVLGIPTAGLGGMALGAAASHYVHSNKKR
jgi:hypothetical protein